MTRGRKQKYNQPKDKGIYVILTADGQSHLKAKAFEHNLSQSELIEQFARQPWLNAQELELVKSVLLQFREDLVKELGLTPDLERSTQLGRLLVQVNQVLQKLKSSGDSLYQSSYLLPESSLDKNYIICILPMKLFLARETA